MLTGTKVTSAKAGPNGVDLEAQGGDGKSQKLSAEFLLVATGRGPVTNGLGAGEAGLQLDRGYIRVDQQYRTSVPGISAIGDVITFDQPGHQQLAHLSSAEGIALAERIAGHEFRAINYDDGTTNQKQYFGKVNTSGYYATNAVWKDIGGGVFMKGDTNVVWGGAHWRYP